MLNHLILASKSPQRKRILKDMGILFAAVPSHIDEHANGLTRPHAVAKSIAFRKAEEVAKKHPDKWVLGCDTFVILSNGRLSIKPIDRDDARETINTYRNSYCDVYSGLALINKSIKKELVGFEKTRLLFRDFTDEEREEYLNSGEWRDRSGSMTIEGRGGKWVKRIKGDYWNVVGLPVDLLKQFLNEISTTAYPVIKGKKTILRPMTLEDRPIFYRWGTASDATPYWYGKWSGHKKIPTYEKFVSDWTPNYFNPAQTEKGQCFMILVKGRPVGMVAYNKIKKKTTELDILIANKRDMSKGYGSDSLKALMSYLSESLGVRICWIAPSTTNVGAIKAYEKAGFKIKKTFKEKGLDHYRMEKVKN